MNIYICGVVYLFLHNAPLYSAHQNIVPHTGFNTLPSVLIEYVAKFNTTTTMTDSEVAAWHEFMLINQQCWHISTQLMQKTLHSLTTGKEYALFKQTMHIYNIAQELTGKPKLPHKALYKKILDTHYPCPIQTRTGLYVVCGKDPNALHTPWGIIDLPQKDNWGSLLVTKVLHTFLSRVATTFHSVALPTKFYGEDVCYYRTNLATVRVGDQRYTSAKRIPTCNITKYEGQRVLIEGNTCGYEPTLMICAVDDVPVEPASYRSYSATRNRFLTDKIFTILLAQYAQKKEDKDTH